MPAPVRAAHASSRKFAGFLQARRSLNIAAPGSIDEVSACRGSSTRFEVEHRIAARDVCRYQLTQIRRIHPRVEQAVSDE
jgi:hypothetical protein